MKRIVTSKILGLLAVVFVVSACTSKKNETVDAKALEQAAVQYEFAYDFYRENELIRALAAVTRGLEFAPNSSRHLNLKGLIHFRKEEPELSEQAFLKALEQDEKQPDVWNNLGTLYYANQRYDDAEAALAKALEFPLYLYPENIYNNIGLVYTAKKDYAKAIEHFEQSIRLRKDYYLPYQNLGKVYMTLENYKRAENLFKTASRLCKRCSEPRYRLGLILVRQEKQKQAIDYFKEAVDLDPNGYYGLLAKTFLVEGEGEIQ